MAESSNEEKTEAPSQRRREDARKEGQVAFSREVSAVALLGSFLLLFYFLGNSILDVFKESLVHAFNNLSRSELTVAMLAELTEFSMNQTVIAIIPFFGVALVVGIMSSIVQVGFNLTLKPLVPKLDKLSPLKGFGRIFSKQAFSEFLKSIFKMGVIGYIGYYTFDNSLSRIISLIDTDSRDLMSNATSIVGDFVFRLFLAFLILAIFDYIFQRWDLEQKLKMSKQEMKEEHKQTEGDPTLKARIRQIQQQLSQARMMQEVPAADVVISNPTHFAIALKYDREYMSAPQVVAKGMDYMALRIIQIAGENNVIVYQNPGVARALFFQVEIGEDLPEEFYKAIAEILAFVYKTQKRGIRKT
ncbi:MAG: flagellar biosynthesis protein FlhB [Deltaproteobacteria bacterium]|nr:flagellar biosynthesis protein FlhB [Deltaproteobacteria bacterium]